MRIFVRYFRPQVYGDFTTLKFDHIDPTRTHVYQLKHKVFIKARVQPKSQRLLVRNEAGFTVEMASEDLLSAYNLPDKAAIILENTQLIGHKNKLTELSLERGFSSSSDISDQVTQVENKLVLSNGGMDPEQAIIDGLCEAIRDGISTPDFILQLKHLYQEQLQRLKVVVSIS